MPLPPLLAHVRSLLAAKLPVGRATPHPYLAQGPPSRASKGIPAPSERRVRSLIPWRRAADAMVEAELRHRVALAEEQLADLKTALDDMRAQRDAWQAMAQARIRPAPSGQSRWPWLRSTG